MTGSLVPPELLAALPGPLQVADWNRQKRAMNDALATDPEQRAVALSALEACLAFMADVKAHYGDEPDWGLLEEFWEYHPFGMDLGLERSLPTLADVTPEKVRAWIETDVDPQLAFGAMWTTPPDEVVGNVGRAWAVYIVLGLTEQLIRWFSGRGRARDHLDASERARLVDLLEEAAPRLPWRLGIRAVSAIHAIGGPGEKGYFDRLASDQNVHEKTRDQAASKSWLIDRQNEPT